MLLPFSDETLGSHSIVFWRCQLSAQQSLKTKYYVRKEKSNRKLKTSLNSVVKPPAIYCAQLWASHLDKVMVKEKIKVQKGKLNASLEWLPPKNEVNNLCIFGFENGLLRGHIKADNHVS